MMNNENKKPETNDKKESESVAKVVKTWEAKLKNKLNSAHNYTVILNMLKDSIEDAELKNSISLANSDEARKRPCKRTRRTKNYVQGWIWTSWSRTRKSCYWQTKYNLYW
nr:hypothetical protein [Mycoplasmopsis bovis]